LVPIGQSATNNQSSSRIDWNVEIQAAVLMRRVDFRRAFVCEIRPDPRCPFALLKSDNRSRPTITATSEMQNDVLACALCVREVIKIYDAAIRCAHKIHGQ
jgi:hypothetical protein